MATADITTVSTVEMLGAGSVASFELDPVGAAGTYTDFCNLREIPEILFEDEFVESTSICDKERSYVTDLSSPIDVDLLFKDLPADADHNTLMQAAQDRLTRKMKITLVNGRTAIYELQFSGYGIGAAQTSEFVYIATKARISKKPTYGLVS